MYLHGKWIRRYYRDCAVTGVIGAEDGRWCTDRLGTYRVKVRYCNCNNKNGCNFGKNLNIFNWLILIFVFICSIINLVT